MKNLKMFRICLSLCVLLLIIVVGQSQTSNWALRGSLGVRYLEFNFSNYNPGNTATTTLGYRSLELGHASISAVRFNSNKSFHDFGLYRLLTSIHDSKERVRYAIPNIPAGLVDGYRSSGIGTTLKYEYGIALTKNEGRKFRYYLGLAIKPSFAIGRFQSYISTVSSSYYFNNSSDLIINPRIQWIGKGRIFLEAELPLILGRGEFWYSLEDLPNSRGASNTIVDLKAFPFELNLRFSLGLRL